MIGGLFALPSWCHPLPDHPPVPDQVVYVKSENNVQTPAPGPVIYRSPDR
jgi:hypothetical protein